MMIKIIVLTLLKKKTVMGPDIEEDMEAVTITEDKIKMLKITEDMVTEILLDWDMKQVGFKKV